MKSHCLVKERAGQYSDALSSLNIESKEIEEILTETLLSRERYCRDTYLFPRFCVTSSIASGLLKLDRDTWNSRKVMGIGHSAKAPTFLCTTSSWLTSSALLSAGKIPARVRSQSLLSSCKSRRARQPLRTWGVRPENTRLAEHRGRLSTLPFPPPWPLPRNHVSFSPRVNGATGSIELWFERTRTSGKIKPSSSRGQRSSFLDLHARDKIQSQRKSKRKRYQERERERENGEQFEGTASRRHALWASVNENRSIRPREKAFN